MNLAHIGTARRPAKPFLMIVRGVSNPTQTPATRLGVNPTNHASTKSFVVPVLPAAGSVKPSALARFAVPASTTSASIVAIRNAVVSETARRGCASFWKSDVAVLIFHALDEDGLAHDAAVRECRIGGRHRGKRDFSRAERERRHAGHGADTEIFGVRHGPLDAHGLEHPHGGAIARRPQRRPHGHRCGGGMFVFWQPRALVCVDGLIQVDRSRSRASIRSRSPPRRRTA